MTTRQIYVSFITTASVGVMVEFEEEELQGIATNLECKVEDLTDSDLTDAAVEKGYDLIPGGVCAQCSGWGQEWSLDLGDWEFEEPEQPEEPNE